VEEHAGSRAVAVNAVDGARALGPQGRLDDEAVAR
jgi:hypothetical protein